MELFSSKRRFVIDGVFRCCGKINTVVLDHVTDDGEVIETHYRPFSEIERELIKGNLTV